jgi:hypothetical protein
MVYSEEHAFGIADGNMHPGQGFGCFFGISFARLMTLHMGLNSVITGVSITENNGLLGEQSFSKNTIGHTAKNRANAPYEGDLPECFLPYRFAF